MLDAQFDGASQIKSEWALQPCMALQAEVGAYLILHLLRAEHEPGAGQHRATYARYV